MGRSEPHGKVILLDYYQGAYGPTIRIDVQEVDPLVRLREMFLSLAEAKQETVSLVEIDAVRATEIDNLILKLLPAHQDDEKSLRRVSESRGAVVFCWSMSSRGWRRCAGLVDGLLEVEVPAHQYLTQEGIDDAIIELAFRE
jgi:hypothetical protein